MSATAVGRARPSLGGRITLAWGASLPRRVVVTTLGMTIIIALLGGYLIMRQVTTGIVAGKRQSSLVEASTALQRMQNQLNNTDLRTESLFERLGQLAVEAGAQPSQYGVILEAGATVYSSRKLLNNSVPADLRRAVEEGSTGLWVAPTQLNYQNGHVEPGLAIGGNLQAPNGMRFPVYFLFSQSSEANTLVVVRNALLSAGALLLVALSLLVWLVSRQVTRPVKEAGGVALKLAEGDLGERLQVRGNDELASLATSMNRMASTLQSQIERLEELSSVQQRFVSDVSHELRTPLTTMRMAGDVLYESREDFDPTARRTSELLHDEIERFELMLADLLEISRFDAGAATLTLEEADVAALVKAEIDATAALVESANTSVELHTVSPVSADCDSRRIRRIIRNLLTNAIEHGEGRPILVSVAGDQQAVAVLVRDHGVGLQPGQTEQVFHRFWRADSSRNRTIGGTGLGLAISLEDARLHHGWLQAWGRPGQGAAFRLTLPRRQDVVLTSSPLPLEPSDMGGGSGE